MTIGQLNVALGLLVNKSEWQKGEAYINHFRRIALTFGAVFGGKLLGKALIGFNADVENSKNQIASMLALGAGTPLVSELGRADQLYGMLRKKAASLPGETKDYVNMLGLLAQPMAKAKLSMEQMSDVTSGAFIVTKALGRGWQATGRNIADFINFGTINKPNKVLRTLLQGSGIDATPEGRKKAEAMGLEGRAQLIMKQSTSKTVKDMAELLGSSFTGRLETVQDTLKQIMGRIGEEMFGSVKGAMTGLASWLTENQDKIVAWAVNVGHYVNEAFLGLKAGIMWLLDHQDVLFAFLASLGSYFIFVAGRAILAWMSIAWPMFAGAGFFYILKKVYDAFGPFAAIFTAIAIAAGMMWAAVLGPISGLVIAFGAVVLAVVYFRDEIGAALSWVADKIMWVINKAKELYNWLSSGANSVVLMSADNADPETRDALYRAMGKEPPTRDVAATGGSGGSSSSVTVSAPTNVTINAANNPESIAKAFMQAETQRNESAARAAHRNMAGNEK